MLRKWKMLQIGDRFGQGFACKVVREGLGTFGGKPLPCRNPSGSGCGSIPVRHSWRLGPAHESTAHRAVDCPACGSAVLFESLRVLNKKKTPCQQTRSFAFYGPGGIRTLDLSDANRTLSHADLKEAPKGQNISLRKRQKI